MVDHIHVPVGGPSHHPEDPGPWIQGRLDRRISRFGRHFFDTYLLGTFAYTLIHSELDNTFRKGDGIYREYASVEATLRKGEKLEDEARGLRKKSSELRNTLTKMGYPLLDTRWHP